MTPMSAKKGTIVRAWEGGIRLAFRLGEVVPHLTAHAAANLWFRVPTVSSGGVDPPGGMTFQTTSQRCVVRGISWGDGPVVYLVHGWGSDHRQLSGLVEPLVNQGCRVVAFDRPSHGQSDPGPSGPGRSHGVELGRALDAVAAVHGPARAVIAHSLGAVATMLTLRFGSLTTERLVFLAPMHDVRTHLDQLGDALGLGRRTRRRLDMLLEARVGLAVDEFTLSAMGSYAGPTPLLVVHDRADRRTAYESSVTLVRGWPNTQLLSTDGLGHRRLTGDPGVLTAVTRFVVGACGRTSS